MPCGEAYKVKTDNKQMGRDEHVGDFFGGEPWERLENIMTVTKYSGGTRAIGFVGTADANRSAWRISEDFGDEAAIEQTN